jgi:hypothetical protein
MVTDGGVRLGPTSIVGAPAATRDRFAAWARKAIADVRGALARRQERPPRGMYYPPSFSRTFQTSIVDRERRRL